MSYSGEFQVFEDIIKEIMIVYKHDNRPLRMEPIWSNVFPAVRICTTSLSFSFAYIFENIVSISAPRSKLHHDKNMVRS